jgi:hypothetical protein
MASTGTGRAMSTTMSAFPPGSSGANASAMICRTPGTHGCSALSVKFGSTSLRSAVCRGGSSSAGMTGMLAPVGGIMIPWVTV